MGRRDWEAPCGPCGPGEAPIIDQARWIREATAVVERWIERAGEDGWSSPSDAAWSDEDLLGHLTAWSDLLIDQVEALQRERPAAIQAVDVDAWNAAQVAERRTWSREAVVHDWHRSAQRAADVIERLPAQAWSRIWHVPWVGQPIRIADLVRLWLVHVEQHRGRLVGSTPPLSAHD